MSHSLVWILIVVLGGTTSGGQRAAAAAKLPKQLVLQEHQEHIREHMLQTQRHHTAVSFNGNTDARLRQHAQHTAS